MAKARRPAGVRLLRSGTAAVGGAGSSRFRAPPVRRRRFLHEPQQLTVTYMSIDRRRFLRDLAGASLLAAGCRATSSSSRPAPRDAASVEPDSGAAALAPAPAACRVTEDNIEGPFYKAGAPDRLVFVDAGGRATGTPLILTGRVLGANCAALAGCTLDVWHADAQGAYDDQGYGFRGVLTSDRAGDFRIETIVPGRYLNGGRYRPAHLHVKLRAPGHQELTTQLYFAGDPYNDGDPFIRRSLIMPLTRQPISGAAARFEFVLERLTG